MANTFTREDLANPPVEETPADEAGDEEATNEEANDDAAALDARFEALQAARPAAVEREQDDEPPRRFTDQLPPIAGADDPMPDLSDEDVGYDNDKYREKMGRWVKTQGRLEARRELREEENRNLAQKVHQSVETKIAAFEKDHPDFATKVRTNKVLATHQLHPDAGQIVARSRYTAELLYRFGTDTDLAIRTAGMNSAQQGAVIDRLITEIEAEKAKTAPKGGQKTLTRKSPSTRDEQLSGKSSMDEIARQSREKIKSKRFYGK
jgi:hypothetical protein